MSRQAIALTVLGALVVVVGWWFLLYSPGQEDLTRVEDEIAAAEAQTVQLQGVVARLETVRMTAPELEVDISRLRGIVPSSAAQPAVLRQLQSAGDDAGVTMQSLSIARPSAGVEGEAAAPEMSLSIAGEGSYFQIVDLIRRIQDPRIVARGIVLDNITVAPTEYPSLTFALSGRMFADVPPVPDPAAEPPPAEDTATEEEATSDAEAEQ